MNKPIITLETLNEKFTRMVAVLDANNNGYMKNFNIIRDQFSNVKNDIGFRDTIINSQEKRITSIEDQIRELARIINDEVMYYKDRREKPPNPDMYAGGFKSRRKTRRMRRKTRRIRRKTRRQ